MWRTCFSKCDSHSSVAPLSTGSLRTMTAPTFALFPQGRLFMNAIKRLPQPLAEAELCDASLLRTYTRTPPFGCCLCRSFCGHSKLGFGRGADLRSSLCGARVAVSRSGGQTRCVAVCSPSRGRCVDPRSARPRSVSENMRGELARATKRQQYQLVRT